MSLLKWQEIAKSKTNLGNKINKVRNTITQNSINEQTSQSSFQKVFKPVTSKLDDVITSNLKMPPRKRVKEEMRGDQEAPDYYPEVDPFEDMDIDNLFDDYVRPEKLEIIIGSKKAGNTSVELRKMGVAILDILLKMSIINKQQYNKLYKMHFKI